MKCGCKPGIWIKGDLTSFCSNSEFISSFKAIGVKNRNLSYDCEVKEEIHKFHFIL